MLLTPTIIITLILICFIFANQELIYLVLFGSAPIINNNYNYATITTMTHFYSGRDIT